MNATLVQRAFESLKWRVTYFVRMRKKSGTADLIIRLFNKFFKFIKETFFIEKTKK